MASPAPAMMMTYELKSVNFDWSLEVNGYKFSQNQIFHTLAGLYGLIALVALIQLTRLQIRVPEFGWTTQKVFLLLNLIVNSVRSVVFLFRSKVQLIKPDVIQHVLLDMPTLGYFTTYALLILFWADIYYQARDVSTEGLRPKFYTINGVVYVIQILMWLALWWNPKITLLFTLSKILFAATSLLMAVGFLVHGGRLFLMLKSLPLKTKARRRKLKQVGYVGGICFLCFLVRCMITSLNAFDEGLLKNHPVINLLYYLLVEILPSCLVLFLLRKLPPKRVIPLYQPLT